MMMVINKSEINYFTPRGIVPTLAAPYYLFELKNDFNPDITVCFNATDISDYSCTYKWFNIIETGVTYQNLTAGTVSFSATGKYTYSIYEASASTLIVSATTGNKLATGIAIVMGADNNNINSIYL